MSFTFLSFSVLVQAIANVVGTRKHLMRMQDKIVAAIRKTATDSGLEAAESWSYGNIGTIFFTKKKSFDPLFRVTLDFQDNLVSVNVLRAGEEVVLRAGEEARFFRAKYGGSRRRPECHRWRRARSQDSCGEGRRNAD